MIKPLLIILFIEIIILVFVIYLAKTEPWKKKGGKKGGSKKIPGRVQKD